MGLRTACKYEKLLYKAPTTTNKNDQIMVLSLINCCIVGMVISYIKQYLVGTPGRFRTFNSSLLRRVRLPLAPPGYLEVREGFEPSVLGICSPLHWASLPPYYCLATLHRFELRRAVLETAMLPLTSESNICFIACIWQIALKTVWF